jgi:hypothetical protein
VRGNITRLRDQMRRTFNTFISAEFSDAVASAACACV